MSTSDDSVTYPDVGYGILGGTSIEDPGAGAWYSPSGVMESESLVIKGYFNGVVSPTGLKTTTFTYDDSATTGELQVINNLAGGNSLSVKNTNTGGYSAYIVRDSAGVERMAIGVGNSASAQPDVVYWECSYYNGTSHTTPPPRVKIQQTGYMFGAYGQYNRLLMTNDGKIQLMKDDGNAGFTFDSTTSALSLKSSISAPTVGSVLDVWGPTVIGDTQSARTNAVTGTPAIGINHSTGVFMRAIYPSVGTFVMQMTGTSGTRALEFVNTDNSSTVMMSMRLNGSGQVTFGGPIIRSNVTSLTATGTVQGDALALTKEMNVVTTAAAGTGVVLPTAIAGMRITIVNRGANTLNVYPATGAQIDALGANVATTVATTANVEVAASSATQWYIVT